MQQRSSLAGADDIGVEVGKVINTHKVGKHFDYTITDASLTHARDQGKIDAQAALDGIYMLRTSVDADTLDAVGRWSATRTWPTSSPSSPNPPATNAWPSN